MKRTEGPWTNSEQEPNRIIGAFDGGYGDDGTEVRFTEVCEVADNEDAPGNRALIKAAPALLNQLKESVSLIERYLKFGAVITEVPLFHFVDTSRRVIAEAEGN